MNRTLNLFAASALIILTLSASAIAQSTNTKETDTTAAQQKPTEAPFSPSAARAAEVYEANRVIKTYYLTSVTQQNDANEILIAMRNVLSPRAKIYLVASQNAIVLSAPPEEQTVAQKVIADLDRPRKVYRLTFTLAESDSGKRVGIQHFSIVVVADQRTVLKQGDKVPVATGTYEAKNDTGTQTQFQYLDIGINVDATLADSADGLRLKSKIEQSSLGQPTTIAGVQEPVFRQAVLEGTSAIKLNKPLTLGSLDIEGSTRHIDIEVVAEPIS
jgi:type II secretory pathway component GspD/PulD (secretin)